MGPLPHYSISAHSRNTIRKLAFHKELRILLTSFAILFSNVHEQIALGSSDK